MTLEALSAKLITLDILLHDIAAFERQGLPPECVLTLIKNLLLERQEETAKAADSLLESMEG